MMFDTIRCLNYISCNAVIFELFVNGSVYYFFEWFSADEYYLSFLLYRTTLLNVHYIRSQKIKL